MVDCDMCGKKNISSVKVKIEGTIMTTCSECSRFGEKLADPTRTINNFTSTRSRVQRNDPDANKFVVKNYGFLIKQARELKSLKQEQVAKMLNEKESIIHKVESGQFKPNFKLARKLEKFFSITLFEEISDAVQIPTNIETETISLTMEETMLAALKKGKK
jgi:putative transcription factor